MARTLLTLPVVFLLLIAGRARAAETIAWLPTLDAALAKAKADHCPVFIAVNMDGERANDEMIRVHYKDPTIVELASHAACLFVSTSEHGSGDKPCPRCGTVTCADHRAAEKAVRGKYLKAGVGPVIAPDHVFLDADGNVLLSVPYSVTVGELEWCLTTALKAVQPSFSHAASAGARPPKRLVQGGVGEPVDAGAGPPPTKKEVDEILERLYKEKKPWQAIDDIQRLLRSSEKKAIEYVENLTSSKFFAGKDSRITDFLHSIGRLSPPDYHRLIEPYLEDERPDVRAEAAVALEQLAEPKALPALQKQFKKEKDPAVAKEMIRAIASCGHDNAGAQKLVVEQIGKAKEPLVRVCALVGLAEIDDVAKILEQAKAGLASDVPGLRAAGGYAIAVRRIPEWRPHLDAAIAAENDPAVRKALASCARVAEGKSASELDALLAEFAEQKIPRDRL